MSLRVAIQMDPLESVNIDGDTTFALAEVAQARGMELFVYGPDDMSIEQGRVTALVRPARVQRVKDAPGLFDAPVRLDLAKDVDVILMRQDRSSPEKIFPLMYPDLMPPTLVSRDLSVIEAFRAEHKDIIIKPLYGHGGAGVFRLKQDDSNFDSLTELFFSRSREPVMVQAFLPAVSEGDKRIILIDGKAAGALNRRPKEGQVRSNLVVGGTAEETDMSDADMRICEAIGPELKRRGLVLTGIDVIGGRLTEVNVTSPTGVQALKKLSGIDIAADFWNVVQDKLASR